MRVKILPLKTENTICRSDGAIFLVCSFAKSLLWEYLSKILLYMERVTEGLLIVAGIYAIYHQSVLT